MDSKKTRRAPRKARLRMTDRERRALAFIKAHIRKHGYAPILTQIAKALKTSTSTAHSVLGRIEAKGYIRRAPHKSRTITIVN